MLPGPAEPGLYRARSIGHQRPRQRLGISLVSPRVTPVTRYRGVTAPRAYLEAEMGKAAAVSKSAAPGDNKGGRPKKGEETGATVSPVLRRPVGARVPVPHSGPDSVPDSAVGFGRSPDRIVGLTPAFATRRGCGILLSGRHLRLLTFGSSRPRFSVWTCGRSRTNGFSRALQIE